MNHAFSPGAKEVLVRSCNKLKPAGRLDGSSGVSVSTEPPSLRIQNVRSSVQPVTVVPKSTVAPELNSCPATSTVDFAGTATDAVACNCKTNGFSSLSELATAMGPPKDPAVVALNSIVKDVDCPAA